MQDKCTLKNIPSHETHTHCTALLVNAFYAFGGLQWLLLLYLCCTLECTGSNTFPRSLYHPNHELSKTIYNVFFSWNCISGELSLLPISSTCSSFLSLDLSHEMEEFVSFTAAYYATANSECICTLENFLHFKKPYQSHVTMLISIQNSEQQGNIKLLAFRGNEYASQLEILNSLASLTEVSLSRLKPSPCFMNETEWCSWQGIDPGMLLWPSNNIIKES